MNADLSKDTVSYCSCLTCGKIFKDKFNLISYPKSCAVKNLKINGFVALVTVLLVSVVIPIHIKDYIPNLVLFIVFYAITYTVH